MTHFEYRTHGTCSRLITLDLDGERVHNVRFVGGCDGNLKAVSSLVEGLTVREITEKVAGIRCGAKNTSCGDQLAQAVQAAYRFQQSGMSA